MKFTKTACGLAIVAAFLVSGCATWDNLFGKKLPDVKGSSAFFLYDGGHTRMMNILSPAITRDQFKGLVDQMKNDGANFTYIFVINEHDGPWTPYSFYVGNAIEGQIDNNIVSEYQWRLDYVRSKDLGVIIWLRADDSPNFNKLAKEKYQADAVKLFDKYASAWCVGLELDEYYDAATVERYAAHLKSLTKKPIYTHQTPMKITYAQLKDVDGCLLQYGFGKAPAKIESDTRNVVAAMGGKPVIAAEYHQTSNSEQAKGMGDAAMRGGAYGTGNGRH